MWIWIGLGVSMVNALVLYCCILVGSHSEYELEKMEFEEKIAALTEDEK